MMLAVSKARRRFFNEILKPTIYDGCVLPTIQPFVAANAVLASSYCRKVQRRSAWDEITFKPPDGAVKLHPGALGSLRFLQKQSSADISAPSSTQTSRKAARTGNAIDAANSTRDDATLTDDLEDRRKKKCTPFKRGGAVDGNMRTRKILMLPTKCQTLELQSTFSAARKAYNTANRWVIDKLEPGANYISMRTRWNSLHGVKRSAATRKAGIHNKIIVRAIKQLADAYATNRAKVRKGTLAHFKIGFRSLRKTKTETLVLEKGACGPVRGFEPLCASHHESKDRKECAIRLAGNLERYGGIRLQDSPHTINRLLRERVLLEDAKIQWNKPLGRFYLIYTYVQPKLDDPDPAFTSKRVAACDPGCNPFQEWYSPTSGEFGVLLSNGGDEMRARCKRLDRQHSRFAKQMERHRQRQGTSGGLKRRRKAKRRRRACARARRRLTGWMKDGHYDAANFLLSKHDVILQPALAVAALSKREGRLLRSKAVRSMYTWSHFLFRQRLKTAATRYPGRHVFETCEPGTSKTCTHCGAWFAGLQLGHKVYCCARCGLQVDRQLAGARNNLFAAFGQAVGIGWDGRSD